LERARRVDAQCSRFEDAWKKGQRPDIAAYLVEVPERWRALLLEALLGRGSPTLTDTSFMSHAPSME
jgi:hypothetical protein